MATSVKDNCRAPESLLFFPGEVILFCYLYFLVKLVLPKTRVTLLRCREPAGLSCPGGGGEQGPFSGAGDGLWDRRSAPYGEEQSPGLRSPSRESSAAVPRVTEQVKQR